MGCIAFSPLAQGMLTRKYLRGVPAGSRASRPGSLSRDLLSERNLAHVRALNEIAQARGQTLAQMALAWALARRAGHVRADRREQHGATGGEPRRGRRAAAAARRNRGDRRARGRGRHQNLGRIERVLTGRAAGRCGCAAKTHPERLRGVPHARRLAGPQKEAAAQCARNGGRGHRRNSESRADGGTAPTAPPHSVTVQACGSCEMSAGSP